MSELRAFHNDQAVKDKYLSRVKAHQLADEIIKGTYWVEDDGKFKGCAVGCTIHGSDHRAYERELGIPTILARLEDGIFESLPMERAKVWPHEFLSAIKIGADLSNIWPQFAVWLLTDSEHGVLQYAKPEHKEIIQKVSDSYARYTEISPEEWIEVRKAAYAAAYAAAAADAAAYAYAAAAAYDKHRIAQADKLLQLLAEVN